MQMVAHQHKAAGLGAFFPPLHLKAQTHQLDDHFDVQIRKDAIEPAIPTLLTFGI